jgi:hypothetical protein
LLFVADAAFTGCCGGATDEAVGADAGVDGEGREATASDAGAVAAGFGAWGVDPSARRSTRPSISTAPRSSAPSESGARIAPTIQRSLRRRR